MTTREPGAVVELRAVLALAEADPAIATSGSRVHRLRRAAHVLTAAIPDVPPAARRSLAALLAPDVVGHPDQPDTVIALAATGKYRGPRHRSGPLTPASQRDLMDGIADLNRAAGHAPYWWQQRGARPYAKHTRKAHTPLGHHVLRQALAEPASHPRWDPYRLRAAALVELLWATGATPQALAAANLDDLHPGNARIRVTINPPGRTAPVDQTVTLDRHARAALNAWLPLRDHVAHAHLTTPDAPANRAALFVTLHPTTADQPDGTTKLVPPGVRITEQGLLLSYADWARKANALHHGEPGWPIPTTLHQLTRGGAENRRALAQKQGGE